MHSKHVPGTSRDVAGELLWTNDSPEQFYLSICDIPARRHYGTPLVTHLAEFPAQMQVWALQGTSVHRTRRGCAGILGESLLFSPECRPPPNSCCLDRVSLCSPSWLQTNPPGAAIIDVSNHTYLYFLVYFTASITAQALKIEILVSNFSPTLLLAQSVLRGKQDGGQNLISDEERASSKGSRGRGRFQNMSGWLT